MNVFQALSTLPTADLRGVAYNLELPVALRAPKSELVEAAAKLLRDPGTVASIVARLAPAHRAALDALVEAGGHMPASQFIRRFGSIRSSFPYQYGEQQQWVRPQTASEALYFHGLIFRGYGDSPTVAGEYVGIADEILHALPKKEKLPFASMLVPVPQPRMEVTQGDLLRDIGMLLCYVQRETVRPLKSGGLAKRDVLRLSQDMSIPVADASAPDQKSSPVWVALVYHLARRAGLVVAEDERLVPSPQAEAWLKTPRQRQLTDLWRRFVGDPTWAEALSTSTGLTAEVYPKGAAADIRRRLSTILSHCPAGTWYSLDSLHKAIQIHSPNIVRESAFGLFIPGQEIMLPSTDWHNFEGPLLQVMLVQSFGSFGIVRLGADDERGRNAAFYVTPTGAILLGIEKGTIPDAPTAPITVQPNFDIVVPAETSPAVLFHLQQFAKLVKRDRASVYVLSRDLIWQFMQAGGGIESAITFLEQASGRDLPQNVAYSLRDWAGRYGELAIESAVLLTASSDALLAEVCANKKIDMKIRSVVSSRAVTLAEQHLPALVERLKKAGYAPRIAQDLASAPASHRADSEVKLASRDVVPLLAQALAVQRLLEARGLSHHADAHLWRLVQALTPTSRRRAERMAEEIVAHLTATSAPDSSEEEANP